MRGHEQVAALRRKGRKPDAVFVDVSAPEASHIDYDGSRVDLTTEETLARQDWRWAIGLVVFVHGLDAERVRAVAASLSEAKAKRVISSFVERVGVDEEWPAYRTAWINDTGVEHGANAA